MRTRISIAVACLAAGIAVADEPTHEPDLLDVKFREGITVRLRGGRPADLGNDAAVRADLTGILAALARGTWDRTHSVDEKVLEGLRRVGQENRGKPLPDLNNYFRLRLPRGLDATRAKEILERFESVQAAYLVPKPVEPPTPPDYSSSSQPTYQDYLDAAPGGIDARNAWSRGWTGAGVRVCDVEYWVNRNHGDLPPVAFLGRFPIDPFSDDHGTSVMGIVASQDNGFGTKGIAPGVQGFFAGALTDTGYNVARALMECAPAMMAGDIVLIEQQMSGPYGSNLWVPTEWSKPVYDAIVTLVANGIVVVETTGNGGMNLDLPGFSTGNDGHWPFLLENDSGALLVTGGQSPHATTPRSYHTWSNYGATVDLQGWGDAIVTTGYGGLYSAEGKNLLYRSSFGGSSGAGPMVVGAVALLQEAHKSLYGTAAPPSLIKHLLVSTGTPQEGTRHLGPLPDLEAALDALGQVIYVDDTATGFALGTSWTDAFRELQDALYLATPGTKILVAEGTYLPDWEPFAYHSWIREMSFALKNGVTLLGGYPNGGGPRIPSLYPSILSGDIAYPGYAADNSYHVVIASSGIDDSAVLDGFTVQVGHADGPYPHDRGGGVLLMGGSPTLRGLRIQYNLGQAGGGIYNENGAPALEGMELSYNVSLGGGAGMWNQGGGPRLRNVLFMNNTAYGEGGGLFSHGGTPHVENATFLNNQGTRGGGLSHWPGGSLVLDNVEFRGNLATADIGGAVMNWLGQLRLNNVTMSWNHASVEGGGLYLFDPDTVTVRNSIVWGNPGGNVNGALASASNSLIQGGYPGTNILSADPQFRIADFDLRLRPGSPAIDAGNPSTCSSVDRWGLLRRDVCDLGAYEFRSNPGTFWSNGEADMYHAAESYDARPVGGVFRQSADDFVVPPGMLCDVSGFRGVLLDGTKTRDAVAELRTDFYGMPNDLLATLTTHAYCEHDPSLTCGESGDCLVGQSCTWSCAGGYECVDGQCVSACILPGETLGYRESGTLWEPRFDDVDMRLGSGIYWLSLHSTVEPGSTGISYAESAGEGAIRSNPYLFREVGFGWVNGGPFFGDYPRDLALDVDAVCLVDGDGDLSEEGVDCDDADPLRSPNFPEQCGGVDEDCDGTDVYAPPSGYTAFTSVTRSEVTWYEMPEATAYDVVYGVLKQLRDSGGDFTTAACFRDQVAGTTLDITALPSNTWFLVRQTNVCGGGFYDDFSPGLVDYRTDEIVASPNTCP